MKLIESLNLLENKKVIFWLNIASIPLALVFFSFFFFLTFYSSRPVESNFRMWSILVTFLLLFVLVILHELIHGLFFKIFNPAGKVKFGFKNGMAYATSPFSFYTKGKFAAISLAPFILITIGLWSAYHYGLIRPFSFITLASLHSSACVGDFYWIYLLFRAPKNSLVEDTEVGINFYEK